MFHRPLSRLAALAFLAIAVAGCSTAPKTATDRDQLKTDVAATIATMKQKDPFIDTIFEKSYGYAVFPSVGKGAVGVGGAYGRGALYEGGEFVGYCDLSQATIGLALGGQAYSEAIFFENKDAFSHFKTGNFAFSAQASAVALTAGASADARYDRGVLVVTMAKGGLMYEASIGGQKFSFIPSSI